MRHIYYIILLIFWSAISCFAQDSLNLTALSISSPGSVNFNDVWGYADATGEYAILGSRNRIYFFDVTVPTNPVLVDQFSNNSEPGLTLNSTTWRDFKTYSHYAYAASEHPSEGLTIFDLSYLPDSVVFVDQIDTYFDDCHNIFIENGRLYAAGCNTQSQGLVVLDLASDPENPSLLAGVNLPGGGYVHDLYVREDTAYCNHGYSGLYIWDFSTPTSPSVVSSISGDGKYNHSNWVAPDRSFLIFAEEVPTGNPMTVVELDDITDLERDVEFQQALLAPAHTDNTPHNPFIADTIVVISYYEDGIQIWNIENPSNPVLVAYYDTYPNNSSYNGYFGCWGAYPYLPSGNILASDVTYGLFVLGVTGSLSSGDNCPTINNGTTIEVTTTDDSGVGSLRQAIICANNDADLDFINFNIPGAGPHIINLNSELPALTDLGIAIDGTTQPGYSPGDIQVRGSNIPAGAGIFDRIGFEINANQCNIFGLWVDDFEIGIATSSTAQQNIIGSLAKPNYITNNSRGIYLSILSLGQGENIIRGNRIGESPAGAPMSNSTGIEAQAINDIIQNNSISNSTTGILITGGNGNRISRNSIYCNSNLGIDLVNPSSNNQHPSPVISIHSNQLIEGNANPFDTIEVFTHEIVGCVNAPCQGKTFLGFAIANNIGEWSLAQNNFQFQLFGGEMITATASDANKNTSEFSGCQTIIACSPAFGQELYSGCSGDGYSVLVNGTVYSELNAMGTETLISASDIGCDSIVTIDLTFHPIPVTNLNPTLCPGETVLVNGTTYDEQNPSGVEVVQDGSSEGCDSVINVNLLFYLPVVDTLNDVLCSGEQMIINGNVYNEQNPAGAELFPGAASNGCDSLLFVDLSFNQAATNSITDTLCDGENLIVNGTSYDFNNPTGTETISNGASNGCDSVITVALSFGESTTETIAPVICNDEVVVVNGTIYGFFNPSGVEFLPGGNAEGCDSTITVSLNFYDPNVSFFEPQLCQGESIVINGTLYDENNPSGVEVFQGADVNGCDSTVNISLNFGGVAEENIQETLCSGDSLTINGIVYNEQNPMGSDTIVNGAAAGCDSVINVNLSFFPVAASTLTPQLCPGESVIVNGVTFDENNPSGMETITGGAASGCDSTITVNLTFGSVGTLDITQTLCDGESMVVNGITYNSQNATGMDTLENASATGCDSIILINLSFFPLSAGTLDAELCTGESVIVNGNSYDENNPTGTEVLAGAAATGCDSTVTISLSFSSASINDIIQTLCPGESMVINGITYDEQYPMGADTLVAAAVGGCDSIIQVNLNFYPPAESLLNPTLCFGENLEVNGTIYDAQNPGGTETIPNASANGCDSTISVNLSFFPLSSGDFSPTLCTGESVQINGTTYDASNPSGTEVLTGAASTGCDSMLSVNLSFFPQSGSTIQQTLCSGEEVIVNGITYNAQNPNGQEVITGGASSGCDSTVSVDLSFFQPAEGFFDATLCTGQSVQINGNTYDVNNPSGTETIPNGSVNGCDSMVAITLQFSNAVTANFSTTLCPGESLTVNGILYDAANSNGTDTIPNGSVAGCDSIIVVDLSFFPEATAQIQNTLCFGESLTVGGEVFDMNNPSGMVVLENGAASGCDSTISIDLAFFPEATATMTPTLCDGGSIEVNGTIYNAQNSTGTEILVGGAVTGCDSVISVAVNFLPASSGQLITELCSGQAITVNGTVYDESNPAGTEILANGASTGCDSTVEVALTFYPEATGTFEPSLCSGASILINGTIYDADNPSGTEVFPNASVNGCDSTLSVSLSFYPEATGSFEPTICSESSVEVNGTIYDVDNPSGTEVFPNASANGCDSILSVSLFFYPEAIASVQEQLCFGESMEINGTIYDAGNPSGTEIISNGASTGCDSIVIIGLSFYPEAIGVLSDVLCSNEFITVNGTVYNNQNPSGIETLMGASSVGCDSVVQIDLAFSAPSLELGEDLTTCEGSAVILSPASVSDNVEYIWSSGQTSSEIQVQQAGLYILEVSDSNGCIAVDSISLILLEQASADIQLSGTDFCAGDTIEISTSVGLNEAVSWSFVGSGMLFGDASAPEINLVLTGPGVLSLSSTNTCGTDSESIDLFTFSLTEGGIITGDTCVRPNTLLSLVASGGVSYEWEDPDGILGNNQSSQVSFLADETRTFIVFIEDEFGCVYADSVAVQVLEDPTQAIQPINTISPNGDGKNDVLLFKNLEKYSNNRITIYNRWGDILYEKYRYENDWDGTYNGVPLPAGVYFYTLRVEGGKIRSSLTIVRE